MVSWEFPVVLYKRLKKMVPVASCFTPDGSDDIRVWYCTSGSPFVFITSFMRYLTLIFKRKADTDEPLCASHLSLKWAQCNALLHGKSHSKDPHLCPHYGEQATSTNYFLPLARNQTPNLPYSRQMFYYGGFKCYATC